MIVNYRSMELLRMRFADTALLYVVFIFAILLFFISVLMYGVMGI